MLQTIHVRPTVPDPRAEKRMQELVRRGFDVTAASIVDTYTLDTSLNDSQLEQVAEQLTNPVIQESTIGQPQAPDTFDWAVEIGWGPGVKDNVADTATQGIEDRFKTKLDEDEQVYKSELTFFSGDLTQEDMSGIIACMYNKNVQCFRLISYDKFQKQGIGADPPTVNLDARQVADIVDILDVDDLELMRIGKLGVFDHNRFLKEDEYHRLRKTYKEDNLRFGDIFEQEGQYFQKIRRGPLSMGLEYMHSIVEYFRSLGRNPYDIELEMIAQTWSEHCKHTIFADPIDDIPEGIFRRFVRGATEEVNRRRELMGLEKLCVSVFSDNAGIIKFIPGTYFALKAETHNSPSALDPYGGAITGIVGVNRDILGVGMGAKPCLNGHGYCFADPNDLESIFKAKDKGDEMPLPWMIREGVIYGVNVGANCSGIPDPIGFEFYHPFFKGKPLVHVWTGGIIPEYVNGRPSYEKAAQPGDIAVRMGGRVGKDGIHGATFSSEEMDEGSPLGAVQIGDPITQKKMSDMLIEEARDLGLYHSITDNGAGGLSCSVAEMAKESGGVEIHLDDVGLKYAGLAPWEIIISESQEAMTLAVPPDKYDELASLAERRGVELWKVGEFNDSGRIVIDYQGNTICDMDMDFLHDGLPKIQQYSSYEMPIHDEPRIEVQKDLTKDALEMLARLNPSSKESTIQQYDHEVQANSGLKPLQGKGRVDASAGVIRPVLHSPKAIVVAPGINPTYSFIDTYHMVACAIDTAVRNAVSVGADPENLTLMDNFCWCSSDDPHRLGQLLRGAQALYDVSVAYLAALISGKDSMFNDFKGYDADNNRIKISIPPTFLATALGQMPDITRAVSLDAKRPGDLVYVVGLTHDELGASEYFAMKGEQQGQEYIGNIVPKVDTRLNFDVYRSLFGAIQNRFVASCQSVNPPGLFHALAKTAMGGMLGMELDLADLPGTASRDDYALFSESQGRFVVTVPEDFQLGFEKSMEFTPHAQIGIVTDNDRFTVKGMGYRKIDDTTCIKPMIIDTTVTDMHQAFKSTFRDY